MLNDCNRTCRDRSQAAAARDGALRCTNPVFAHRLVRRRRLFLQGSVGRFNVNVTVAICTHNRADLLDQTLAALRLVRIPHDVSWELLVVDNNSTDGTSQIITEHRRHLPIRPLFETQLGLCAARNRAIRESRGALILWTDDDVIVDPNWIVEYVRAAREFPDASYFGGTVE